MLRGPHHLVLTSRGRVAATRRLHSDGWQRPDVAGALRRHRPRTRRAHSTRLGGPPAWLVALVPRRAAEPVRGLHRPGSRRRLTPRLRAQRRTRPAPNRGLRPRDLQERADRAGPLGVERVRHTDWDELEIPARHATEVRTGPVRASRKTTTSLKSQLAVVLDTDAGTVSVKGLPLDHPGTVRQEREAMINLHVRSVAHNYRGTNGPQAGTCWPSSTSTAPAIPTTAPAPPICRRSSAPCTVGPRSAVRTCR